MLNSYFVIYLIALSTGTIGISISSYLSLKYRMPTQIFFTLALIAMSIELLYFMGRLAFPMVLLYDASAEGYALKFVFSVGIALFLYTFPSFVIHIFRRPVRRAEKAVFLSMATAVLVYYGLHLLLQLPCVIGYAIVSVFHFGTLFYCFGVGARNLKRFADRRLKRILVLSIIISLAIFPLLVYDFLAPEGVSLSLPTYFFAFNLLGLLFSFVYSSVPPFLEQSSLPDFFARKYNITKREQEILELMKLGFSNNEIGKRMFISLHTVENHIYNIYRKLDVKNRGGAFNRLDSYFQNAESPEKSLVSKQN